MGILFRKLDQNGSAISTNMERSCVLPINNITLFEISTLIGRNNYILLVVE